jgi:CheY-like chemotaxis protein
VSLARNGLEAVALLKENGDIDLALTDCDMPVLGGGELLERLRSEWPSLRVVAMSGALLASHRPPKPGAPAPDARLDKPFSTERLLQTLRDTLCARPT